MIEQIITKSCTKCQKEKPLSQFRLNKECKNGRRGECKQCHTKSVCVTREKPSVKAKHNAYNRQYAKTENGKENKNRGQIKWRRNHPDRHKAHIAVTNAILAGDMQPASKLRCDDCEKQAYQWHHHKGYSPQNWLDVIPLCPQCHIIANKIIH